MAMKMVISRTCDGGGRECWKWAQKYFNDCICGHADAASLLLGLLSVFFWVVAEVPQIMTNFKEKSVEGVSLAFLITWIIGDLLNLLGCYLEPATLPTQLYTALLFACTTLILLLQTVYYGYIRRWRTQSYLPSEHFESEKKEGEDIQAHEYLCPENVSNDDTTPKLCSTKPILMALSSECDHYYLRSARSLASGHTPMAGSYSSLPQECGEKVAYSLLQPSSYEASSLTIVNSVQPSSQHSTNSETKGISTSSNAPSVLKAVFSVALFMGAWNLPIPLKNKETFLVEDLTSNPAKASVFGRKLLYGNSLHGERRPYLLATEDMVGNTVGFWLGWAMAAVYTGGRLPQIYLNARRGTAEGLNPFMFMFAVIGNATYIASILARSIEWEEIRNNLPWLADAGICMLMDSFILLQFIYFYYLGKSKSNSDNDYKPLEESKEHNI